MPELNLPRVFVIVPVYNESEVVRSVLDALAAGAYEIVLVNDGSTDDTARRLEGLSVHLLEHYANRGQGAALQTGIAFALLKGAEAIVTFDADGQHDPADIPALVGPVLSGACDLALGSRFLGRSIGMPPMRRLLLRLARLFTLALSRVRVTDPHNGLRAFSRGAATDLNITMDRMAHASEIVDQIRVHHWRYTEVPVTVRYTKYSMAKGQTSGDALRIAFELLMEKMRR